jgi:hypothetical protein
MKHFLSFKALYDTPPVPSTPMVTLDKKNAQTVIVWMWGAKHFFDFAIKITLQALRFQPNGWHQSIQRENLR